MQTYPNDAQMRIVGLPVPVVRLPGSVACFDKMVGAAVAAVATIAANLAEGKRCAARLRFEW